ncbi:heptaprenyl diphosphate synthase component 1 [Caldibacillus lycopersici]|uniref:Heptaprenyl diphosphate synthase component 1 n=1 Tax=Perspicuibacillus lycopersici TaxID=1325689 RepID=A0AAE3IX80_9BACI|nr:heptaprenyl diphosphate synthase component 1 [Perspicuibacillus lycopersici]MCU9613710.1 heptaprenyl diphosphate synthase component 1 [Perspicuibacillus lycopersici]
MQVTETMIHSMEEKILEEINHPYLTKQIDLPPINSDKLRILLSILLSQNLSELEVEKYIITVLLIQIALDTHDLVKNDEEYMPHKKRQLTVLAGDYFSGLYYKTLAQIPNVKLVKSLAEGIKIVNENKISIYKNEIATVNDYLASLQQIETALFQQVASFFQDSIWALISKNLLHMNQIIRSKDKLKAYILSNKLKFAGAKLFRSTQVSKEQQIDLWLDNYIEILYHQIEQYIDSHDLHKMLHNKFRGNAKLGHPIVLE